MIKRSIKQFTVDRIQIVRRTSLYSNAFFLMLASLLNSAFGLGFWVLATRLSSPSELGLASTLMSMTTLFASFSTLGLGYGMIRFLPTFSDKQTDFVNSCLNAGALTSLLASVVFIVGIPLWSPALSIVHSKVLYSLLFVFITVSMTMFSQVENALIAHRRSSFVATRYIIWGVLRFALLPVLPLVMLISMGIFVAWGIPIAITVVISLFWFMPAVQQGYRPRLTLNLGMIKQTISFSALNYMTDLVFGLPGLILPLVIVNMVGADEVAYFAVALTIGNFLKMVASSASRSLLAEGSHQEDQIQVRAWQCLKFTTVLLVPTTLLVVALSGLMLTLLYGNDYAHGATRLTQLFALDSLPAAVISIYLSVQRVKQRLFNVVAVSVFCGAGTLGLSVLLIPWMGINGTGVAFGLAQLIVALPMTVQFLRKRHQQ